MICFGILYTDGNPIFLNHLAFCSICRFAASASASLLHLASCCFVDIATLGEGLGAGAVEDVLSVVG